MWEQGFDDLRDGSGIFPNFPLGMRVRSQLADTGISRKGTRPVPFRECTLWQDEPSLFGGYAASEEFHVAVHGIVCHLAVLILNQVSPKKEVGTSLLGSIGRSSPPLGNIDLWLVLDIATRDLVLNETHLVLEQLGAD